MESDSLLNEKIFSVSQITGLVKEVLETSFVNLKIEGEISNWRPSTSGHIYFTLKDDVAQLKAVIFRSSAYKLSFSPKNKRYNMQMFKNGNCRTKSSYY